MTGHTSIRERLEAVLDSLPEERAQEVLDFAEFLASLEGTDDEWHKGILHLAGRFWGDDEPEYTLADIKSK